jgi:hypothetical protein
MGGLSCKGFSCNDSMAVDNPLATPREDRFMEEMYRHFGDELKSRESECDSIYQKTIEEIDELKVRLA